MKKTESTKERFDALLGEIKNRAYVEIQKNNYNKKVEKHLMIKELIKEQLPDENLNTTAG